jgi:hypothetical protein
VAWSSFVNQHLQGAAIMGKSQDTKKETKKQPTKTAKEKKAEKRVKKEGKIHS